MSNKALEFAIVAKDEATKQLAAAKQAFKDAQDAAIQASKTAKVDEQAQKALAYAIEQAKKAQNAAAQATRDLAQAEEWAAQAAAKNAAEQSRAEGKITVAKSALDKARAAHRAAGDAARDQGREINRLGRLLDNLSMGNIRGAIGALGNLGPALLGVSGILFGVKAAFEAVGGAIKAHQERQKQARIEEAATRLASIEKEGRKAADAVQSLADKYGALRDAAHTALAAAQEAARAGRALSDARDELDFQQRSAGLSGDALAEAQRQRERQRLMSRAFDEANAYNRQMSGIGQDDAYLEKEIQAAKRQAKLIADAQSKARQEAIRGKDKETRDAATEKADALLAEELEAEKRIRALERERAALADRRNALDLSHEATLTDIEAQSKKLTSEEERRVKAIEEARAAREKERSVAAQAATESREAAVAEAKELAALSMERDAGTAAGRFGAEKQRIEAESRWSLKPLRDEADAAKAAKEEAERLGDAEKIADARLREHQALEALAKQEAVLEARGLARLAAIAKQEEANANARHERAMEAVRDANAALKAVNMNDVQSERDAIDKAKEDARSRRKFERTRDNAQRAWQNAVGGAFDADKMWDIKADGSLGNAQQAEAFKRLSKRDQAALLAEARKQQAKREADAAANKANADAQAAAKALQDAATNLAAIDGAVIAKNQAELIHLSQIDMGEGE